MVSIADLEILLIKCLVSIADLEILCSDGLGRRLRGLMRSIKSRFSVLSVFGLHCKSGDVSNTLARPTAESTMSRLLSLLVDALWYASCAVWVWITSFVWA